MVHLAHRPRIRGVKYLPRDEVHVGILVSLHLCVRAVFAKVVLLTEGEASVYQLIVAQLQIRQVPVSQACSHFVWTRLALVRARPMQFRLHGCFAICMLGQAILVFALLFGSRVHVSK